MYQLNSKILYLVLIVCLAGTIVVTAEKAALNPLEWLEQLEIEVLGQPTSGSLLERLNHLEELMTGRVSEAALAERLARLDALLYINQPHDISLIYKIQALEWILYKKNSAQPLVQRVQGVEVLLLGATQPGPITKRMEQLVTQVFPQGIVKGRWVNIPEGLLLKVELLEQLSSTQNKAGDHFRFTIKETVYHQDLVLFPQGVTGSGIIQQIKQPANLGRDARLAIDFGEVRAMDGTLVRLDYNFKAQQFNRSQQLAVGASTAGMLAFGPEGILVGLAVRGREKIIPAGTVLYVQVKEPIRVYTLPK